MYILILFLPILSTIIVSLFGRKLGRDGTYLISVLCLIIVTGLSIIGVYESGVEQMTTRIICGD